MVKLIVHFSLSWYKNFSINEIEKRLPFMLSFFEITVLIGSNDNVQNIRSHVRKDTLLR